MTLEEQYRKAVAALEAAQQALGALPNTPEPGETQAQFQARRAAARSALKAAAERCAGDVREAKDRLKEDQTRRVFAGIGSPLHMAIVAALAPDVVAKLEAAAIDIQADREAKAAARRAAKAATVPATAPSPPAPEVIRVVRSSARP